MFKTPYDFAYTMKDLSEIVDREDRHRAMDEAMCDLLISMGYEAGVHIFQNAEKWYA